MEIHLLVHSLIPFICIHVVTLPTWCMYACAAPTLEDPITQPNSSLQDTYQGNRNRRSQESRPSNLQQARNGGHEGLRAPILHRDFLVQVRQQVLNILIYSNRTVTLLDVHCEYILTKQSYLSTYNIGLVPIIMNGSLTTSILLPPYLCMRTSL